MTIIGAFERDEMHVYPYKWEQWLSHKCKNLQHRYLIGQSPFIYGSCFDTKTLKIKELDRKNAREIRNGDCQWCN